MMETPLPDAVRERSIFERLDLLVGADAASALGRTRVIIFGVGGVGGWCAESLVRSGVGHLTLVDSDRVCASNVNRQVVATTETVGQVKVLAMMATTETVGQVKVLAMKERLSAINPDAEIEAVERFYSAETCASFGLDGYDYVIDAIDSLREKAHLINAVTRLERPVLFSSMGAARKMDPFRIRKSEFWKVSGDGLARALRTRFRKTGEFPAKKFTCVWSDESLPNAGAAVDDEVRANGTIAHVTAVFGFALASLVVGDACR